MSTKIYDAFKVKDPKSLQPLLWKIRDEARKRIVQRLKDHYWEEVCNLDPESRYYRNYEKTHPKRDSSEARYRLELISDRVRKGYKENSVSHEWGTYSLDVCVAVYPYGKDYYLRTFCERGSIFNGILDFVEKLPELEEYHYQNSTDRPKAIAEKDWAKRRRVWEGILKENQGLGNFLTLEILSYQSFWQICPYIDILREWQVKGEPPLPSREEVCAKYLAKLKLLKDATFKPGKITAKAGEVSITLKDGKWVTRIPGEQSRRFKLLVRATDHVYFEHLPDVDKEMIRRLIERGKELRRNKRRKK